MKTAEDFLAGLATGSSVSGKPYRIRLADGREMESAAFFRGKLAEIDRAKK